MQQIPKQIIFTITLLSLFTTSTHTMLNNIAGTHDILHDDYKYLSLVHGAIAWETGVIRRLYDFGQIFPIYGLDKQSRKVIENYQNPEQSSKLIRLIHAFFYRVPGSTAETDFGTTIQLAHDDPNFVVPLVAELIVQCKQLQQQHEKFHQAVDYVLGLITAINDSGWLPKLGKKITQKNLEQKIIDVQEKPWNENASTAFVSMCKSFTKNLAQELGQCTIETLEQHQQAAETFFNTIKATTNNLRKLFNPEVFKKREQVESFIVNALNESDPSNPQALYPEHTVEMILLAFIYKKYSANRMVLKAFYDTLNAQLEDKALKFELCEEWIKDSFCPVTQSEARTTIENILNVKDLQQSIAEHFAEFVYNIFQLRTFTPVGYANAVYEYAQNKKTPPFADCMDNAIRNFINAYAYNDEQNKFALTTLLANTNLKKVLPDLASFLQSFTGRDMGPSQEAHNAWLQVISNIPYVAYNQMINRTTGETSTAIGKGYIVIPKQEQNIQLLNWLKKNNYQILTTDEYGYELQPSLKNIIIVLDYLLQLHLFDNAGDLAKEFMRPDFIKEYFPKLCAALNAHCFMSTQDNAKKNEPNKNFDTLDYTATDIFATITMAKTASQFKIYSSHGELHITTEQKEANIAPLIEDHIADLLTQPSLSLLATYLLCSQRVTCEHLKDNKAYIYLNLFAIPLENTGLLEDLIDEMHYPLPLQGEIFLKDLLMRLAEKQADEIMREKMLLKIASLFIRKTKAHDLKNRTDLFQDIAQLALRGMMSQHNAVKSAALNVLRNLVEINQGFNEAIEGCVIGSNDQKTPTIRSTALNILRVLVEKNQGFSQAITAAVKGSKDQNHSVRNEALLLFRALVEQNQGFPDAIAAASQGFIDKYPAIRESALQVAKTLAKKNQELDKIIKMALKGIMENGFVKDSAFALLNILITITPDQTKQAIRSILNDENILLDNAIKQRLEKLIEQK